MTLADNKHQKRWDVLVIGGGNAALCAALARKVRADVPHIDLVVSPALGGVVVGYETAAGRRLKSPHSGRSRTWRLIMEEEAGAYAKHCRAPEKHPFKPYTMGY